MSDKNKNNQDNQPETKIKIIGDKDKTSLDDLAREASRDDAEFITQLLKEPDAPNSNDDPENPDNLTGAVDCNIIITHIGDLNSGQIYYSVYNRNDLNLEGFEKPVKSAVYCYNFRTHLNCLVHASDEKINDLEWVPDHGLLKCDDKSITKIINSDGTYTVDIKCTKDQFTNLPEDMLPPNKLLSMCWTEEDGLYVGCDKAIFLSYDINMEFINHVVTKRANSTFALEEIPDFGVVDGGDRRGIMIGASRDINKFNTLVNNSSQVSDLCWNPDVGLYVSHGISIQRVLDVDNNMISGDSKEFDEFVEKLELIPDYGIIGCTNSGISLCVDKNNNYVFSEVIVTNNKITALKYVPE
ncbi:hypothetical protein HN814_04105 [Candidatus Woesearchaeota archaeon]|nr:hypothetical protein [Candidatus Woesearchaeota archaeon]